MCYDRAAVAAYAGSPRKPPTGPPRTTAGRSILAETGTRVRRLKALRYGPHRIAEILGLNENDVREFLERLRPLRAGRQDPARLVRPRSHVEAENARQARLRAAVALKGRLRRIARRQTELQRRREADAAWGPRGEPLERDEWTAARARLKTLKASPPADVAVDQAVAELAIAATSATPWEGATTAHFVGARSLTSEQIAEARDRLLRGESWPSVARHFNVSTNTLRRYIADVPRRRSVGPGYGMTK